MSEMCGPGPQASPFNWKLIEGPSILQLEGSSYLLLEGQTCLPGTADSTSTSYLPDYSVRLEPRD